ncbi:hypothetical protein [Actinoplanes utahensis]|uniref:Uncharacterized protein n=1 Tax=Actinoplanes utahensis TaxID=1869 RepID=A0A0A6UR34_ACTUT|nr:hypothetical protein [Actinoplanes utahensis]KHD77881.1 hypothetical protein MB27_08885 [Actinoplanes utahensis]GIF32425.1 hypothetical protein Aut01nite_54110 [Actinoplanes utahensis]
MSATTRSGRNSSAAASASAGRAGDILWLHLCNAAYFIRTDDLGWPLDESETWLVEALSTALLAAGDPPRQAP